MSAGLVLRGGRVVDPAAGLDGPADVRLAGDRIERVAERVEPAAGDRVVDVAGLVVTPGLVDPHVHLREPGGEGKETIATGAAAAAAGGFTTVCAMPNTSPVVDTPELVRSVLERAAAAGGARIRPIGAATVGSRGETPTDAAALARAGAVAVSDDGLPIRSAEVLAAVLEGADRAGIVVAEHCEVPDLAAGGAVREGPIADALEVGGIPAEAESDAVARDLDVLARTGGRLHLCHLSTERSVELVRDAKARGLDVTAEVCPHHLTLTAEAVLEHGADAKMNPPLGTELDRVALVVGLADGTIDCVATDHAPHTTTEKSVGLTHAPFGVVGLETAFALLHTTFVRFGRMSLATLVERMTVAPARALGLAAGRLAPGDPADVAVFDLERGWRVDPDRFLSKGRSSPWKGSRLVGRAVLVVVGGEVVHDDR